MNEYMDRRGTPQEVADAMEYLRRYRDEQMPTTGIELEQAMWLVINDRCDAPAWHDKPTCPGWWLCVSEVKSMWKDSKVSTFQFWTQEDLDRGCPFHTSRVFGPIPADEVQP